MGRCHVSSPSPTASRTAPRFCSSTRSWPRARRGSPPAGLGDPDEDFYQGHYPGAPITPGVLLCESVFQTASAFLAGAGATADRPAGMPMIVKINDVRFRHPVLPGDTTLMEVKRLDSMGGFTMMSGNMKVGGKLVMSVQFSVTWRVPAAKSES